MNQFVYEWLPGDLVRQNDELVQEMCALYSMHYGVWSHAVQPPREPGARIRLNRERMAKWLQPAEAKVAFARLNKDLIGYAIAVQAKAPRAGMISWVTQLVVHEEHRTLGVGKELIHSIWSFSDHFAWGLLTANPYAVRALEKATRRRCDLRVIKRHMGSIIKFGQKHVPYLGGEEAVKVNGQVSCTNTNFFVDHSNITEMLDDVTKANVPWTLGNLEEGWEWFAFTFKDQDQIALTPHELENMLSASDQVTRQAYRRMPMNDLAHRWAAHASSEIDFILCTIGAQPNARVLDLGCGSGRHSIELAGRGYKVDAIDLAQTQLEAAVKKMDKDHPVNFVPGDVRDHSMGSAYELVLCLYDVIGSYTENDENERILRNIQRHLGPGGYAVISVMNYEHTLQKAKHTFRLSDAPDRLTSLPPSDTMESTGDIFNPDFYLVDTETRVVYRKEQFSSGSGLPQELLVRDRRYSKDEIEAMCSRVGLSVLLSKFVRAGRWDEDLSEVEGKEILLVCRNPE